MKVTVPVTDVCEEGKAPYGNERLVVCYGYSESFDFDYKKLDETINRLVKIQKQYKGRYDSLEFRKKQNCGCWGYCKCEPSIVLYGTRDENEVEKKVRRHNSEIDSKNQEERERREYEALKKKFNK